MPLGMSPAGQLHLNCGMPLKVPGCRLIQSASFCAGMTMRGCSGAQVQMSLSQRASLTAGGEGVTLLHELLGFLRRSLSQQAPVRRAVYQVLAGVCHDHSCPRVCHESACMAMFLDRQLRKAREHELFHDRLYKLNKVCCPAVSNHTSWLHCNHAV